MKKLLLGCAVAAVFVSAFGQAGQPKISSESRRYREYRLESTTPTYGLRKVKALIRHLKADSDSNQRLPSRQFQALNLQEKFTYCMLHAEDFSQNCDVMMGIVDEEKKIFGYLPGAFGDEAMWSDQQKKFLHENKPKVEALLRSTIRANRRVGLNLKCAITELDAYDLIPDLVAAFEKDERDLDILTVFMTLMKDGGFKPFLASITYKKLYDDKASYQAFVVASSANRKLMIDRVTTFYKSRR